MGATATGHVDTSVSIYAISRDLITMRSAACNAAGPEPPPTDGCAGILPDHYAGR
jgi:hypothetical protein